MQSDGGGRSNRSSGLQGFAIAGEGWKYEVRSVRQGGAGRMCVLYLDGSDVGSMAE